MTHLKPWLSGAVVIGCRHFTAELIDSIVRSGADSRISGIVGLSKEAAVRAGVPEWRDLKEMFGKHFPVYLAETYNLSSSTDKSFLSECRADVGLCIGWQRLLPTWFLNNFRNGVFGHHACANLLPNGRGRSPITWALINGASLLYLHIFKYEEEPDAGNLLAIRKFKISDLDDINTLQQKCRALFSRLICDNDIMETLVNGSPALFPQSIEEKTFSYPKRSEQDGLIDWTQTTENIFNFVRAQTKPYPGAFVVVQDRKYKIWRSAKTGFSVSSDKAKPGTIVEAFQDGNYWVQTGTGLLTLIDHELPKLLRIGTKLYDES